jgi:hypothetical protein
MTPIQKALKNWEAAANAAMAEAIANGRWDPTTLTAKAEAAAAKKHRRLIP